LSLMTPPYTDIDRRSGPSWWLQIPGDSSAAVAAPPEPLANEAQDIGAYYRTRAAEFRRRAAGPNDDSEWDELLF
jgi:hypothetical protein